MTVKMQADHRSGSKNIWKASETVIYPLAALTYPLAALTYPLPDLRPCLS